MGNWPEWWLWELELSPHLLKRMVDRRFNEVDLRLMLNDALDYHPDIETGRWVIRSSLDKRIWEIVVEPVEGIGCGDGLRGGLIRTQMRNRYLEVTYRNGKPLAAYLYLARRPGDTSARTSRCDDGLLIDFTADDRPIGIEITAPGKVSLAMLNRVLESVQQEPATPSEMSPVAVAG